MSYLCNFSITFCDQQYQKSKKMEQIISLFSIKFTITMKFFCFCIGCNSSSSRLLHKHNYKLRWCGGAICQNIFVLKTSLHFHLKDIVKNRRSRVNKKIGFVIFLICFIFGFQLRRNVIFINIAKAFKILTKNMD